MYISKQIKIHHPLVIDRIVNGHLHQQSFVFHHNVSSKRQHRYPSCFNIFQNPCPFIFINFANFINSKASLSFWKNNCTRFETTFQLCSPSTSMTKFEQGWFYEPYNEPPWNVNPNSKKNC
jgi:hypothetical protein